MQIVSVLSQKGGVGKTTLAVHMAVAASKEGRKTLLLDMDEQQTALAFLRSREAQLGEDEQLAFDPVGVGMKTRLAKAHADGFDLVVIDSPPHSTSLSREAVKISDVVLMPCRPNSYDVHAITRTSWLRPDLTEIPAAVVLTQGRPNSPKAHRENGEAISQIVSLDVLPDYIPLRNVWSDSAALGLTILDQEGMSAAMNAQAKIAAKEFDQVWTWVKSSLEGEVK